MKKGPHLANMTGFGDTDDMMAEYTTALKKKINPASCEIMFSVPRSRSHVPPEQWIKEACEWLDAQDKELVLSGYSVGGLYTLIAACRTDFRNISHLFLIDAPRRSDVEVHSIRMFREFQAHYDYRKKISQECERYLSTKWHPPIIAMGSLRDGIVPPASKFLDGRRFDTFEMEMESDANLIPFDTERSLNVFYPSNHTGHPLLGERVELVTDIQAAAERSFFTLQTGDHGDSRTRYDYVQEC